MAFISADVGQGKGLFKMSLRCHRAMCQMPAAVSEASECALAEETLCESAHGDQKREEHHMGGPLHCMQVQENVKNVAISI